MHYNFITIMILLFSILMTHRALLNMIAMTVINDCTITIGYACICMPEYNNHAA